MLLLILRLLLLMMMMLMLVYAPQEVKKMDRQPSLCSQLSMMQMRNSMGSTSDTDDVLNQILRGSSTGSSLRKCSQHHHALGHNYCLAVEVNFHHFKSKSNSGPVFLAYESVNLLLQLNIVFLFKCVNIVLIIALAD